MLKKEITVKLKEGIDVENAGKLASASERFNCKSEVLFRNNTINMDSLLNLVSVGITHGESLVVVCSGDDESVAIERFGNILEGIE